MAIGDIGFIVSSISATIPVVPDKGLSRSSEPLVRSAKFGDGYEQRVADGLNSLKETFTLTFSNRSKTEADDINTFFNTNKGVTAFNFTFPDSNSSTNDSTGNAVTTIKVVCSQWSQSYTDLRGSSISATFNRVYEP
tara:strand:+ start:32 stop:442 length:411 start_codon:yes stop_codon:yes gene_type:complete